MNKIEIVPFSKKYVEDVLHISTLSFKTSWTRESIENELENKFARYVVALKEDLVLGYGGVWLIVDEGHITNIAVHPEYRGIGIGDMLVDALVEICILEGIGAMTLEVRKSNTAAQNLYLKHGFQAEGLRRNYYSDTKEDGIIMWNRSILK